MDRWIIPVTQGYIESKTCDLQEMYSHIAPEMMVRTHFFNPGHTVITTAEIKNYCQII